MKKSLTIIIAALALISCREGRPEDKGYADTSKYELVWEDQFDYKTRDDLLEVWESSNGPSPNTMCSRWPENIELADGMVRLVNHKENRGGQDWTSARMWTKEQYQYGYYECRYKYAAATGTNNSFWISTLRNAQDPAEGKRFELDINEGHYPDEVNVSIHNWTDEPHKSDHKAFTYEGTDFSSEFHVWGLEWNRDELVFFMDGQEIRHEKNEFSHSPAPILLSLAITKFAGDVTDAADGSYMEVDWVKVYKLKQ